MLVGLLLAGDPAVDIIELLLYLLNFLLLCRHHMQILGVYTGFLLLVPNALRPNLFNQLLATLDAIFDGLLVSLDQVGDESHVFEVLLACGILLLNRL